MYCVFNRMISICFCDFNWAITVTNLLVNYLRNNEWELWLSSIDTVMYEIANIFYIGNENLMLIWQQLSHAIRCAVYDILGTILFRFDSILGTIEKQGILILYRLFPYSVPIMWYSVFILILSISNILIIANWFGSIEFDLKLVILLC